MKTHKLCGAPRSLYGARIRGGFLATRVKRETLENYETEPGRLTRRFTLHDASLGGPMHAAAHNVNRRHIER
jgi:hypothetical protein